MAQRAENRSGVCLVGERLKIASYNLHLGEEPPVSGSKGSGTIFFSGCTLKCVFCQNYPISQFFNGEYYGVKELSNIMQYLQKQGAHNINLVSPTPYLPHFVEALYAASREGLNIPVVYNTSGYERREVIEHLEGLVDIYMPDIKYIENTLSFRLSGVSDYVDNAFETVDEMYRQVGALQLDDVGVGVKGLIIRHLILPGQMDNSRRILKKIASRSWSGAYLSLMSQFFPAHRACETEVDRRLSADEYREIRDYAWDLGFREGWFQDI